MKFPLRILFLLILLPATSGLSDVPQKYQLVKIFVPDHDLMNQILEAGVDLEGSSGRIGEWMEFVAGRHELRELTLRGIPYQVLDEDYALTMSRNLSPVPENALGFGFGSMGGYYTYDEVGLQLDSMKILYPALITDKQAIGYSHEGRAVWAVKISDNASVSETGEAEALFTALHHAREPAGMMSVIYYMWWLLENYGTDPDATYLVDNRQLWFVPVVNPDGYVYNQTTNPSGGGLWRKNRRDNGSLEYGVDLNRNYGPMYMWDSPNGGSSTIPSSSTYRGPSPFSEPECQAIMLFTLSHTVRTCLNYHTSGQLLIYPYGYQAAESEDSIIFRQYAFDMVRMNRYTTGTDRQTVHYGTRGNSDDYMYGDTTKTRTFAMTPEVGTSFWPASSLILPMAEENLHPNIYYSYAAGQMSVLSGYFPDSATGAGGILAGGDFSYTLRIENEGLETASQLSVEFSSDSSWILFPETSVDIDSIGVRSSTTIPMSGTIAGSVPHGVRTDIHITITDPWGYERMDTIGVYTGPPEVLFEDDADSGMSAWSAEGTWWTSFDSGTGSFVFDDSPGGNYASSSSTALRLLNPVNLAGCAGAILVIDTRWAIEPTRDFAVVEVSTDGGTWIPVGSGLSNPPSGYGAQTAGLTGYDGYSPGPGMVRQEFDLSSFPGSQVSLRFRLLTDGSEIRDGWHIDNVRVTGYRAEIPGSPLTAASSISGTRSLFFGESPSATDGIDSLFGETELSPMPGPDTFDVRWEIPGTNGTAVDLRDTLTTGTSVNIFLLAIQAAPEDYPLTLGWDRKNLTPGSWRIRDHAGEGAVFNRDMWLSESLFVTDASVNRIEIVHRHTDTAEVQFAGRWNMVSLPVVPSDASPTALFPDAVSSAYMFDGDYTEADSLTPGTGYWMKFANPGSVAMAGTPYVENTLQGTAPGWKLIGSSYCPVAVRDICPLCPAPPLVYGYHNGYQLADTLFPGSAYWYRGDMPVSITCDGGNSGPGIAPASALDGFNTLEISANGAGAATLYFRTLNPGEEPLHGYLLPPPPPAGGFDVRFDTQLQAEYFEETGDPTGRPILFSSAAERFLLTFQRRETGSWRYEIRLPRPDGSVERLSLRDGEGLSIPNPHGGRVELRAVHAAGQTTEFRIYRNYPNPFNPRTTIRFNLPVEAVVRVTVRNVAGQEVGRPLSGIRYGRGEHEFTFDAASLPTGTYFYTLTALPSGGETPMTGGGKFIIIR